MSKLDDCGYTESWPGFTSWFENLANDKERDLAGLEPAWGKAAVFFRTGHRFGHRNTSTRLLPVVEVHRHLGVFKTRFEEGETLALLHAISMCAEENLPLPQWLAEAFTLRMQAFLQPGQMHSLDAVFSSADLPSKSPKRAAAARLDWQLGGQLYRAAWNLVLEDETIDSFDAAVERLLASSAYGVGKTKAKALITALGESQSQFLGRDVTVSGFLTKRRKRLQ